MICPKATTDVLSLKKDTNHTVSYEFCKYCYNYTKLYSSVTMR